MKIRNNKYEVEKYFQETKLDLSSNSFKSEEYDGLAERDELSKPGRRLGAGKNI